MNTIHDFKTKRSYLLLMLKKGMKLIPFFAFSAAVAAALILIASAAFSAVMNRDSVLPKAQIALVVTDGHLTPGDETYEDLKDASPDFLTRMAVNLVSQMDSVSSLGQLSFLKLAEADQALRDGSIDMAIYISSDTYNDINSGENTPIIIRLASDTGTAEQTLFSSLIAAGVRMIRTIEAAVYAPILVEGEYTLVSDAGSVGNRIFDICLQYGMSRNSIWNVSSLSAFGELSSADFYLISALVLLLGLFGLGFSPFYTAEEREVIHLLGRGRAGRTSYQMLKAASVTVTVFVFALPICLALVCVSAGLGGTLTPESVLVTFARFIPVLLPVSCLIGAVIHLTGNLISEKNRSIFYLLLIIALFVLTGGLLPTAYLPDVLRSAAAFSPTALCQQLLSQAFLNSLKLSTVSSALVESAVLLALSVISEILIDSAAKRSGAESTSVSVQDKNSSEENTPGKKISRSALFLIRGKILLKRHVTRPAFWLIAAVGAAVCLLLSGVALPGAMNVSIGLGSDGSPSAESIVDDLLSGGSVYHYVRYTSDESMQMDVASGKLDCAFAFDETLADAVVSGSFEKSVRVYTSSSTTKYLAAREEVFAALLGPLTDGTLDRLSDQGDVFSENSEEAKAALREASSSLRTSDAVLSVYFENIVTGELTNVTEISSSGEQNGNIGSDSVFIPVMLLLLFAGSLFFSAAGYGAEEQRILHVISPAYRQAARVADTWIPLMIYGVILTAAAALSGGILSGGPAVLPAILVPGLFLTAVWTAAFSALIRNESVYLFLAAILLILAALFMADSSMVSLGILTKQFGWLRMLLPTTWMKYLAGMP